MRGDPQGIFQGDPPDEFDDLEGHIGTAVILGFALPPPEQTPALPMPGDDGFGFHQSEGIGPTGPVTAQNHPKGAVPIPKLWPVDLTLQHQDLLAQGQILEQEVTVGTKEVPEIIENEVKHNRVIG